MPSLTASPLPLVLSSVALALALAANATGCATSSTSSPAKKSTPSTEDTLAPAPAEDAEEYLVGTVTTTSPDGATPFGPKARTVAHRVWKAGTIVETVFHDGALQTTTLAVNRATKTIAVQSEAGGFTGTLAFEGDSFLWTRWTYSIAIGDGGATVTGSGRRDGGKFTTTKLYSEGGAPTAKIVEQFRVVDKATFDEELKHLRKDERDEAAP